MNYTKSNFKLGQLMHKEYKIGDVIDEVAVKEFRGIPGIRPDFVLERKLFLNLNLSIQEL